MTVDQLQSIEDITSQVQGAMTGTTDSAKAEEQAMVIKQIQQDCSAKTGLMCQVVTLYNGGRYSLYRYKRFTDVRLVMAPEENAAFFGGDPDNFTYPRYDLDLTLLRVYENGAPFKPTDYLKWSDNGPQDNQLVFVIGNPGSTERLSTVAQLEFNRDLGYPMRLASYVRNLTLFREQAAKSPELARAYQNEIFEYENSYKAVSGFLRGLRDSSLMARKRAFEAEVRARVAANPKLRAEYGGAWDAIANAVNEERSVMPRLNYYFGGQTPIFVLGRYLVRAGTAQPSDTAMARIRMALMRPQAMDTFNLDFLTKAYALQLHDAQRTLPADDPYLKLVLQGQTPEAAAQRIIQGTKVQNVQFRQQLLQGGASAIQSSTDPVIALFRHADSLEQPLRERAQEAQATIATNSAAIGRALYEVYGTILPPDATFTLRISDGVVKGYPMNGTKAPYKTSIYGLFARSAEFDDVAPFHLSDKWVAARTKLDMKTPLDFVSTNDIIGGNSGSPVINKNGEVVGLIFDGNIESLPNRFVFTDEVARSVSVDSRAITEALRNVYGATRIANELEGKGTASGAQQ
jgi:hypothetical protein